MQGISEFVMGVIEGRDPVLGEHHQRTGLSAVKFAKRIGCSAGEIEVFSVGMQMHDLGKMSISEYILNKPARLTLTEFSLVKQHTEIGFQLLVPLHLDPRISETVRFHHENLDGSGYPTGLAGEAIPLFARMARILDSFDAITANRPYHKGAPSDEALELLQRDSRFYDPDLLKEFCEMVNGGEKMMNA